MNQNLIEKTRVVGLSAKGVVYMLVGGLTAMAALELGGETAGKSSTIHFLRAQPFGQLLLWILVGGLAAYVFWRIYAFFDDPRAKGDDATGWAQRSYSLISAAIYGSFGVSVARAALAGDAGSGEDDKKHLAAQILQAPGGPWILGALGVVVCGFACYQAYRSYSANFMHHLRLKSPERRRLLQISGRVGYGARANVFGISGYFLLRTAIEQQPAMVKGTEGAFDYLSGQPWGHWLVGTVALGLIGYGAYSVLKGAFTRAP